MKEVTIPILPSAAQRTPGYHAESPPGMGRAAETLGSQCHGPGSGTGSAAQWLLPLVGHLSPVLGPGRGWGEEQRGEELARRPRSR